jgi:hypothetical protein
MAIDLVGEGLDIEIIGKEICLALLGARRRHFKHLLS